MRKLPNLQSQNQENEGEEQFNGVLNSQRGLRSGRRSSRAVDLSRSRDSNSNGSRVPLKGIHASDTDDALSVTGTRVTSGLSATIVSLLVNNDSATDNGLVT